MANKIRILDELTVNQIAAGEVIENPASAVKELVENSLDAGATDIHVEIASGGRQLIRVVDNGCGMTRDDALLSLERHATSKMRQFDDLQTLLTMGFRGEALPSIAAISKLTLITATQEDKEGTLLVVEGGKILKCCGAAREIGTTLEVKTLFYNVPVRKKFLKSPAYDTAAVQKTLTLLALANPTIRITLISDQQSLLMAPAASANTASDQLLQRTSTVFGQEFINQSVRLEAHSDAYRVFGLISLPMCNRPNRTAQYLFINGRSIQSMLISAAVREGYGSALPNQRYPGFVLHLQIPGEELDINVHPQKREVRLRQEQKLREWMCRAVDQALQKGQGSEPTQLFVESPFPTHPLPTLNPQNRHHWPITPLPWDPPIQSSTTFPALLSEPAETPFALKSHTTPAALACTSGYVLLDPLSMQGLNKKGLWVVDQRAAHHRIVFDRLAQQASQTVEVQPQLVPLIVQLAPFEMTLLFQALPELRRIGIELEALGPSSVSVQALPVELQGIDMTKFLMELVEELRLFQSQGILEAERRKRMALQASRAALNRQQQLTIGEANRLMMDLFACENPYLCPQGKPILICLEPDLLAKLFTR